jgi:hypothetical protein
MSRPCRIQNATGQACPNPPLKKGGNYKELLLKSPFEKEGLRGI